MTTNEVIYEAMRRHGLSDEQTKNAMRLSAIRFPEEAIDRPVEPGQEEVQIKAFMKLLAVVDTPVGLQLARERLEKVMSKRLERSAAN